MTDYLNYMFYNSRVIKKEGSGNMTGKVKWFNNEKGYGFIECENLDDIFVHYSAIIKDGYKTLKEGSSVNFKLVETAKGLQALEVSEEVMTVA